jgi:trk system potassium uptake protein TrkA
VRERTYQQLGLDYVCGTTLVAENLLDKIKSGHGHHLSALGDVEIVEFKANAEADGRKVRDIESDHQSRIIAVSRGKTTFVPQTDSVLQHGDIIVAAVKEEAFTKLERYMED